MQINTLSKDNSREWNEFCLKSRDAWFWHTTKWLDYCVSYGSDKYNTRNMSFYVADDNGILAICPLLIEKNHDRHEFTTSGSGGYGIAPAFRDDLTEDRREKLQKEMFLHLDDLAIKHEVARALFRLSPLASEPNGYNWLLKYGYMDNSINSQVIDLTLSEEALWSSLRKGHKYDVNRGEKYYEIKTFDRRNPDKEVFEQYRILHHKAAGRVTRPVETFERMYQWIVSGEGMLCGITREKRFVGFSYINLYKDAAYYSSASDDPEFKTDIPISHVIQWSVIRALKECGCKYYEIGAQQFGPQLFDQPSAKDLSISFFKRGFGGRTVPYFRGEKYYDHKFMGEILKQRVERLTGP